MEIKTNFETNFNNVVENLNNESVKKLDYSESITAQVFDRHLAADMEMEASQGKDFKNATPINVEESLVEHILTIESTIDSVVGEKGIPANAQDMDAIQKAVFLGLEKSIGEKIVDELAHVIASSVDKKVVKKAETKAAEQLEALQTKVKDLKLEYGEDYDVLNIVQHVVKTSRLEGASLKNLEHDLECFTNCATELADFEKQRKESEKLIDFAASIQAKSVIDDNQAFKLGAERDINSIQNHLDQLENKQDFEIHLKDLQFQLSECTGDFKTIHQTSSKLLNAVNAARAKEAFIKKVKNIKEKVHKELSKSPMIIAETLEEKRLLETKNLLENLRETVRDDDFKDVVCKDTIDEVEKFDIDSYESIDAAYAEVEFLYTSVLSQELAHSSKAETLEEQTPSTDEPSKLSDNTIESSSTQEQAAFIGPKIPDIDVPAFIESFASLNTEQQTVLRNSQASLGTQGDSHVEVITPKVIYDGALRRILTGIGVVNLSEQAFADIRSSIDVEVSGKVMAFLQQENVQNTITSVLSGDKRLTNGSSSTATKELFAVYQLLSENVRNIMSQAPELSSDESAIEHPQILALTDVKAVESPVVDIPRFVKEFVIPIANNQLATKGLQGLSTSTQAGVDAEVLTPELMHDELLKFIIKSHYNTDLSTESLSVLKKGINEELSKAVLELFQKEDVQNVFVDAISGTNTITNGQSLDVDLEEIAKVMRDFAKDVSRVVVSRGQKTVEAQNKPELEYFEEVLPSLSKPLNSKERVSVVEEVVQEEETLTEGQKSRIEDLNSGFAALRTELEGLGQVGTNLYQHVSHQADLWSVSLPHKDVAELLIDIRTSLYKQSQADVAKVRESVEVDEAYRAKARSMRLDLQKKRRTRMVGDLETLRGAVATQLGNAVFGEITAENEESRHRKVSRYPGYFDMSTDFNTILPEVKEDLKVNKLRNKNSSIRSYISSSMKRELAKIPSNKEQRKAVLAIAEELNIPDSKGLLKAYQSIPIGGNKTKGDKLIEARDAVIDELITRYSSELPKAATRMVSTKPKKVKEPKETISKAKPVETPVKLEPAVTPAPAKKEEKSLLEGKDLWSFDFTELSGSFPKKRESVYQKTAELLNDLRKDIHPNTQECVLLFELSAMHFADILQKNEWHKLSGLQDGLENLHALALTAKPLIESKDVFVAGFFDTVSQSLDLGLIDRREAAPLLVCAKRYQSISVLSEESAELRGALEQEQARFVHLEKQKLVNHEIPKQVESFAENRAQRERRSSPLEKKIRSKIEELEELDSEAAASYEKTLEQILNSKNKISADDYLLSLQKLAAEFRSEVFTVSLESSIEAKRIQAAKVERAAQLALWKEISAKKEQQCRDNPIYTG